MEGMDEKLKVVAEILTDIAVLLDSHKNCTNEKHIIIIKKGKLEIQHNKLMGPEDKFIAELKPEAVKYGMAPNQWQYIGRKAINFYKAKI